MNDTPQIIEYCVHISLTDHNGIPRQFTLQVPAVSKRAAEEVTRLTVNKRSRMPPKQIHYIQA